jgi:hypothetical protein
MSNLRWQRNIALWVLACGLAFTGSHLAPQNCGQIQAQQPAADFPTEFVHWEPYAKNPIFTGSGPDHWDVKIRERGWIIKEGSEWSLWYTGYDGTKTGQRNLGYATSSDGLTWTRFVQHPIHDERWVEDVCIQKVGDIYYMFAEGLNDQAQLLISKDKLHWQPQGTLDIRYTNGKPLTPGPFGTPTAYYEEGTWYLFFERSDQAIWLAKSKDLKVWQQVQDEPVIGLGPEKYDSKMIAVNQVIKHKGKYYAVLHGSGSEDKPSLWTTNLAVSDDLIHWKKYSHNPLRPESENKSSGQLVWDGEQFRLYTMHDQVQVHFPPKK